MHLNTSPIFFLSCSTGGLRIFSVGSPPLVVLFHYKQKGRCIEKILIRDESKINIAKNKMKKWLEAQNHLQQMREDIERGEPVSRSLVPPTPIHEAFHEGGIETSGNLHWDGQDLRDGTGTILLTEHDVLSSIEEEEEEE